MRITRDLMGMPVTIDIVGASDATLHERAFELLYDIDLRFSPYRDGNELSALNQGAGSPSPDIAEILALAERTRTETDGYFDIRRPDGRIDPSGIVKGWAIARAADLIHASGSASYFVDAGGDIASRGHNAEGQPWRVGIRHPFELAEIVQVVIPDGRGVATSGTYLRGQHIYDPYRPGAPLTDIVSLTVIADDVIEADRFATAGFAMGEAGIQFIERRPGLEGYAIGADGIATMTSGWEKFTA